MNRIHPEFLGGLKPQTSAIYCGAKPSPPRGKVRGRPNQCFLSGRRTGFYAGIQEGLKQGIAKAKISKAIRVRSEVPINPLIKTIKVANANNDILKGFLMRSSKFETGAVRKMSQSTLREVFKKLGISEVPILNI